MFDFNKNDQQQKNNFTLRVVVAGLFALCCFGLLSLRFWVLQVERHEGLSARADSNRLAVVPIAPRRGEIFDRNGEVLARNYLSYTLEVVPARAGNIDELFQALTPVVFISAADQRRFKRRAAESGKYASIVLRNNLNETEAAFFSANSLRFTGVQLRARWVREYPQGKSAGHVVGYVGRISEGDVAALEARGETGNYRGTDIIGKKGLEKTYEATLHGKAGLEELEVTARGKPVRVLRRVDPTPGSNLVLSLDMGLQRIAEEAFKDLRGALVAIEPATGDVLAFVSQPSFDPNLFIDGIDVESWRLLNESPDHPLINRPVYGTYPIGSTYKPFVALAALELNKRRANDLISDPGYFEFGGQRFRNSGSTAFGTIDMYRALVVSSDTYFYSLGPEIGVNGLHDFMKPFGFGQITGIDIEGERRGVLPSTDWKRGAYKNREQQRWYAGETISVAVGQGYNSFTLMQLAQATAVLANDGVYMKPHLVRTIKNARTDEQTQTVVEASHKIPLKKEHLQVVKRALTEVTVSGTAAAAFVGAPYTTAGKTGTAQVYSLRGAKYQSSAIDERLRDHSLFMAFAPATQPKIAIAVIVENAGWGGSVAAPIVRKVFDAWLLHEAKTKPVPSTTPPTRRTENVVPDASRVSAALRATP
jgi:penicillin-binding protein 2